MPKYLLLLMFYFFTATGIIAQDKIETDRPDQTELATLTPLHYFQGEFGFTHESYGGKEYKNIYPNFLLKYGLAKNFELRLQDQLVTHHEESTPKNSTGFEPLEIGFRLALCEQKKIIPKTALITQVAIPVFASKSLQADHLAPVILLAMENDVNKKITLNYNLGAEWDGFKTNPEWLYSLSCGLELGEKWESYIEFFGKVFKNEPAENSIDGGLSYYVNNNIKLDASAGFGVSKAANNYFAGLGFSFRIK